MSSSPGVEVSDRCGPLVLTGDAVWVVRLAVSAVFGMAAWGKVVDHATTRQAAQEFGGPCPTGLTLIWAAFGGCRDYHDLGGDYFTRRDPERAMRSIVRQANALGFTVRFDPIQAA